MFNGEEIAKGDGLGEFPVLHANPRFGLEVIKYVPSKNGAQGLIDNIVQQSTDRKRGQTRYGYLPVSGY